MCEQLGDCGALVMVLHQHPVLRSRGVEFHTPRTERMGRMDPLEMWSAVRTFPPFPPFAGRGSPDRLSPPHMGRKSSPLPFPLSPSPPFPSSGTVPAHFEMKSFAPLETSDQVELSKASSLVMMAFSICR